MAGLWSSASQILEVRMVFLLQMMVVTMVFLLLKMVDEQSEPSAEYLDPHKLQYMDSRNHMVPIGN